ncbi:nuclear transport factor 2 family protein [Luteibacter sp. NPDC031894]|uniref:nuclear transport factor 2 family protein n=1 Tax=Luteibacter sp. NPDC031894 TaxID=3390572 RepID=UPI003CFD21EF
MRHKALALGSFLVLSILSSSASAADEEAQVRAAETRFWTAYNACDMTTMSDLIEPAVEFYHDKGGLTSGRQALIDSLRKGPCGDPKMHLRREAVASSITFHSMKGGYGLITGHHLFYVTWEGKPEHLDGQADFTTLWKDDGGKWRMYRVLSYDHGPVP